jgi:hypothetical protein
MARVPYVRYLRYRDYDRLRYSNVFSSWLNAVAAKLGETSEAVFNVMKEHRYTAAQVDAMARASETAPHNTILPAITGTPTVGQTLTASTGTWAGTAPITYAYQWLRAGAAIGGAVASTYVLVAADATHAISVQVTAHNALGDVTVTSVATAAVAAS